MPKSSPSTDAIEIEVIDLDATPGSPSGHPEGATSRGPDWRWLIGGAALLAAALAFFPGADRPPSQPQSGALPEPAVATTQPAPRQALVSVTSGESFPLQTVSGLDGFVSLTPPAEFDGRFWIVGNLSRPTDRAIVLSSIDGGSWSPVGEIVVPGAGVRIDDLVVFEGQLLAAGTTGTEVGRPYLPLMPGGIAVWRSPDGISWSLETIVPDTGDTEHWTIDVITSGGVALVTGYSSGMGADPLALESIPAELEPALERGDLAIWPNGAELIVVVPPGIEVLSLPAVTEDYSWDYRMFRSTTQGRWREVDLKQESLTSVVAAPGGGFLATNGGGAILTSAFGETWLPNTSVPAADYRQWGDRIAGIPYSERQTFYWLGDRDGFTRVQFLEEMGSSISSLMGGNGGLIAISVQNQTTSSETTVIAGDYTLTTVGGSGLRIEDAAGEGTYMQIYGNKGTYDPDTELLTVVEEGRSFTFPIAGLGRLWQSNYTVRSDVYVAADGLHWARSQSGLIGDWMTVLGATGDSFLLASTHYDLAGRPVGVTVTQTGPAS